MNKHWLIIGLGAAVISLAIITTGFFDKTSPQGLTDSTQPLNESAAPTTNSGGDKPPALREHVNAVSGDRLEQAKQEIFDAQVTLNNAEVDLESLEIEMEEVERYIENLEQKGEDPAKHAEEGMLLLGPLIEKYEATLAIVEAAEKELAKSQATLLELN